MIIEMGNTATLVPSEGPEGRVYTPLSGQQVLVLKTPDDRPPKEVVLDIVTAVTHHMDADANGNIRPAWIECGDVDVLDLLCKHYGLTKKHTSRPKTWGQAQTQESAP